MRVLVPGSGTVVLGGVDCDMMEALKGRITEAGMTGASAAKSSVPVPCKPAGDVGSHSMKNSGPL